MRRLLVIAALALAAAPAAQAAPSQESWFQDDNRLEFSPPAEVNKTLDRLDELGVDRLRVSVFWVSVAPDPDSDKRPDFDARDPDAYPQAKWERFDHLVREAAKRGIGIMWDITGPAPDWATGSPKARTDLDDVWTPDPKEFGDFVAAFGTRYSGSFIRPEDRPKEVFDPGSGGSPLLPGYVPPSTTTTEPGPPLPRVDHWEIWNEPNWGAWLAPQSTVRKVAGKKQWVPNSPRLYRRLADAMYAALVATGHEADTIMLGATAPKGIAARDVSKAIRPADFIRDLYCVNGFNQVFKGSAAKVRGCPSKDQIERFPALHPVLFKATGYSHHPYELTFSPHTPPPDPKYFTIANLDRLSHTLRFAWLRYRQPVPSGGVPLYLTEFGYQTNPPDRAGVSLAKQAAYISEAEYITWKNRSVRSLTQYLLVDGGKPVGKTFQTGLLFVDGRTKPALQAYKLPIFLPRQRIKAGSKVLVWGLIRPGANDKAHEVKIQWRAASSKTYRTLATRKTSEARGYLYERVRIPGTGRVRLFWNGQVSRSVNVWAR